MEAAQHQVWTRIRQELGRALGLDPEGPAIGLDSRLRADLGLSSLKTVDLVVTLEEVFDLAITDDELASLVTVRDLVELVVRRTAAPAAGP